MGQLLKVKIMNNKCFKPQNDKKVRELISNFLQINNVLNFFIKTR